MQKRFLSLCAFFALSPLAYADTLFGVYAQADYWQANKGQYALSASVEHGVPLVPNVRVRTLKSVSDSAVAINRTEAIGYYEILDNVVSLDVGVGAGVSNGKESKYYFDSKLPLVYVAASTKLPKDLTLQAEMTHSIVFNNFSLSDVQAQLGYKINKTLIDADVHAGYRAIMVKQAGDSKIQVAQDFAGPYVGAQLHF